MRHLYTLLLLFAAGCNPYGQRDGEFIAGAVDPASFPPPYLGAGGDRTKPGRGSFTPVKAWSGKSAIGYYSFPFSTAQLGPPPPPMGNDPLKILDMGKPNPKLPVPTAYSFDPATTCNAPSGYAYDPQRDEVRFDQQGAIVTALPSASYSPGFAPSWSYVPIVSEVQVQGGFDCQSVKSEETLKKRGDLTLAPTGNYLAWAIIDVAAPVYKLGENPATSSGTGAQSFGWFNHYITAYLDGGVVPTTAAMDGTVRIKPQTLYIPKQVQVGMTKIPGAVGQGYDVLDAARADAAYSPVCQVMVYDTGMTTLTPDQLPKDAATILAMYVTMANPLKPAFVPYVYCLQVQ